MIEQLNQIIQSIQTYKHLGNDIKSQPKIQIIAKIICIKLDQLQLHLILRHIKQNTNLINQYKAVDRVFKNTYKLIHLDISRQY